MRPASLGTDLSPAYRTGRTARKYGNASYFDQLYGNPSDHVAFGIGTHSCPGQGLARLEAHAVLEALAEQVTTLELAGEPRRRLANTTRSLDSLPVRVR